MREWRGEGATAVVKRVNVTVYPDPPAVYIVKTRYPEYPASGPEYPDSPEFPGPGPETPAPPETEHKKNFKELDLDGFDIDRF